MTRLFIENYELDITADITAQLNYAVDDLINLDSKTANYSKTIVIPGTSKNNALFGNIFEFGNSNFPSDENPNVLYNFNASKSAQARIEINGMPTMKGILRLMSIIIDRGVIEYEIVLFSELAGLISAIGNKKLEDLDFSEYNVPWNYTRITNSWNNSNAGRGVVFPLIDYGNVSTNKHDYLYKAFRPAMFVKEYIEKIIAGAGYTHTAYFLEDDFFKRLIIPHNDKELIDKSGSDFVDISDPDFDADSGYNKTSRIYIGYNTFTLLNDFTVSGASNSILTYTGTDTRSITINLTLNGTYEHSMQHILNKPYGVTKYAYLFFTKNGTAINNIQDYILPTATQGTGNGPFTYSGDLDLSFTQTFDVSPGDTLQFYILAGGNPDYFEYKIKLIDTMVGLTIVPNPPGFIPYSYDDNLQINYAIPKNIFQRDFFTSIMKMFNLMIIESKTRYKHLYIIPNVDFYDINNIVDWSDKVNRNKPIQIKPMSEINARYYNFNFKSDSDYYNEFYKKRWNENYGDRQYDNEMEFATQDKKLEVIFSPSVLVGYTGEDKVVSTICKIDQIGTPSQTEEAMAHNIRIMQCAKIDCSDYTIFEDTIGGSGGTYNSYLYAGHFNNPDAVTSDLNFGATKELFYELTTGALQNNVFNAFYSTYMAEITDKDSRLVTCEMYLDEIDIFNIDFRKLIFFDGVLYRLYKITDWSEGELCKVQLLRVINTAYDSNTIHYGYVQICNQIWAKSNLNVTKYRNGDPIPLITDGDVWREATSGARCFLGNNSANGALYGQLYNGYAALDPRNIAPEGWRMPTVTDFEELISCLGYTNAQKLKALTGWNISYPGTNETGFNAYQAGYRDENGDFYSENATFYSNTLYPLTGAINFLLLNDSNSVISVSSFFNSNYGASIRLIIE